MFASKACSASDHPFDSGHEPQRIETHKPFCLAIVMRKSFRHERCELALLDQRILRPESIRFRKGFTLVELMVVVSIIGIVLSLLLVGVSSAREASRRMACSNNLRQQALALQNFVSRRNHFPYGGESRPGNHRSWATSILPDLERSETAHTVDQTLEWDHPKNRLAVESIIPSLRCPSSTMDYPGDTDYAAITGSAMSSEASVVADGLNNGVMILDYARGRPVSVAEIIDGLSNTICIAELADRTISEHGRWADVIGCISHNNGGVNEQDGDGMRSQHPGGVFVALSDGAVRFLSDSVDWDTLGGLCSRAGYESIRAAWDP